jgi:hypothetical protein
MATEKIVNLPVSVKSVDHEASSSDQLELFNLFADGFLGWVLLNPAKFAQSTFLRVLARNEFHCILDFRSKPVFQKPGYDHKSILSYLYSKGISYIDIASLAHGSRRDIACIFDDVFSSKKNKVYSHRLVLCLADEASVDVVSEFRRVLRESGGRVMELHPMSVLR